MPNAQSVVRVEQSTSHSHSHSIIDSWSTNFPRCYNLKSKSPRWNIPQSALALLERVFLLERFPAQEMRQRLAQDLDVTSRQVQVWFQNRRQRERNMQRGKAGDNTKHDMEEIASLGDAEGCEEDNDGDSNMGSSEAPTEGEAPCPEPTPGVFVRAEAELDDADPAAAGVGGLSEDAAGEEASVTRTCDADSMQLTGAAVAMLSNKDSIRDAEFAPAGSPHSPSRDSDVSGAAAPSRASDSTETFSADALSADALATSHIAVRSTVDVAPASSGRGVVAIGIAIDSSVDPHAASISPLVAPASSCQAEAEALVPPGSTKEIVDTKVLAGLLEYTMRAQRTGSLPDAVVDLVGKLITVARETDPTADLRWLEEGFHRLYQQKVQLTMSNWHTALQQHAQQQHAQQRHAQQRHAQQHVQQQRAQQQHARMQQMQGPLGMQANSHQQAQLQRQLGASMQGHVRFPNEPAQRSPYESWSDLEYKWEGGADTQFGYMAPPALAPSSEALGAEHMRVPLKRERSDHMLERVLTDRTDRTTLMDEPCAPYVDANWSDNVFEADPFAGHGGEILAGHRHPSNTMYAHRAEHAASAVAR